MPCDAVRRHPFTIHDTYGRHYFFVGLPRARVRPIEQQPQSQGEDLELTAEKLTHARRSPPEAERPG